MTSSLLLRLKLTRQHVKCFIQNSISRQFELNYIQACHASYVEWQNVTRTKQRDLERENFTPQYVMMIKRTIVSQTIGTDPNLVSKSTNPLPKTGKLSEDSLLTFNEDNFIYEYIHRRLNGFECIGEQLSSSPIGSSIDELKNLVSQKYNMDLNNYKTKFNRLSATIRDLIYSMNQQELTVLLNAIKTNQGYEFTVVKKIIDAELVWLLKKDITTRLINLDSWFYLADTFYECSLKAKFVTILVDYLANENEALATNKQFLHLLFLIIQQRNQRDILYKYEDRILKILDAASYEDLAIICLAYFKTKTSIKNQEVLKKIINRTIEITTSINPQKPGYCSIIKCIRYSRPKDLNCREDVVPLIETLREKTDKIILSSPYNAVQTIKMMESFRIHDSKLLNIVADSMFNSLPRFRIKDIQYTLTTLSNLAFKDLNLDSGLRREFDSISEVIVSESREDSNFQYYHLMPILRAFSIFGYYNNSLIEYANKTLTDPTKLSQMQKRNWIEFQKSALLVYVATRLEGDGSVLGHNSIFFQELSSSIERFGNLGSLRPDSRLEHLNFILSKYCKHSRNLTLTNYYRNISMLLSTSEALKDSCFKFNFQHTLPHQNFSDLIISKDHQIPGSFDKQTLTPQRVPDGQRHCLIMGLSVFDYVDGSSRISGFKQLVTRLLTKLGYTVIHVDFENQDIGKASREIKLALDSV